MTSSHPDDADMPAVTAEIDPALLQPPPEHQPDENRPAAADPGSPIEADLVAPPPPWPVGRVDALAGICILALVVSGLGAPLPGGPLALDALLVAVGFRLATDLRRLAGTTDGWVLRFWTASLGPIAVPAILAALLATGYWWWLDRLESEQLSAAIGAVTLTANWTQVLQAGRLAATDHLWVIALIAQFTILLPLTAVAARRSRSGHLVVVGLAVVAASVALTRLFMAAGGADPSVVAVAMRADGLLVGALVALAPRRLLERIPPRVTLPSLAAVAAIVALSPDPAGSPLLALGLLSTATVIAAGLAVAGVAGRAAEATSRPVNLLVDNLALRWLGQRAIGIYVWHQLFGMALSTDVPPDTFGQPWPGSGLFVIQLVFALAAGSASYRYLQLPLRTALARPDAEVMVPVDDDRTEPGSGAGARPGAEPTDRTGDEPDDERPAHAPQPDSSPGLRDSAELVAEPALHPA